MAAALPGSYRSQHTAARYRCAYQGYARWFGRHALYHPDAAGNTRTATVGVNGAMNAAILACEMISLCDEEVAKRMEEYKAGLGAKIEKANKRPCRN